jgi:EmrB/QacA subfamily drug resistance transporter
MLLIDVTIVNVALPSLAEDLRASFAQMQWVIDVYPLALATLLLGAGALSDHVGRRHVFVGGLGLFALASLACGLSGSAPVLIGARVAQGVGAAGMFATTIALISSSYSGQDRRVAFGVWGAINSGAAAVGPVLGGVLTESLSWRWVFFVNLPISAIAITLSLRLLPDDRTARAGRIDLPGVLMFMVAAGAGTYALTHASENGWLSRTTLGAFTLSGAAVLAFLLIERRTSEPILDLALLRRGSFSGVLVGALLLSVSAFAYLAYVSVWLQAVRGLSPIEAGLVFVPLSIAALLVSLLAGRYLGGVSARWMISGGLAVIGFGALLQAHLGGDSAWSALLAGQVLAGVGIGLAIPVLAAAALAAVPPRRAGMAAGALTTARQLGWALGIATLGLICQGRISTSLGETTGDLGGDAAHQITAGRVEEVLRTTPPTQRAEIAEAIQASFASGLNVTLVAAGVAGLVGAAIVATALRPRHAVDA